MNDQLEDQDMLKMQPQLESDSNQQNAQLEQKRRWQNQAQTYFANQKEPQYPEDDPRLDDYGLVPESETDVWCVELKGMSRDKDLKIFCDLLLKFASKFKGVGLDLIPADVKTIE